MSTFVRWAFVCCADIYEPTKWPGNFLEHLFFLAESERRVRRGGKTLFSRPARSVVRRRLPRLDHQLLNLKVNGAGEHSSSSQRPGCRVMMSYEMKPSFFLFGLSFRTICRLFLV